MCGIIGLFPGNKEEAAKALGRIAHRGRDQRMIVELPGGVVGHVLHALVGEVKQPVKGKGTLLFNGEIYNWRELADDEDIRCANDTELLLALLDKYGVESVRDKLDGVYAIAYIKDGVITLERDLLGVKPMWYSTSKGFRFASERKALDGVVRELHPRTTLTYDIRKEELKSEVRKLEYPDEKRPLAELLGEAVKKRLPEGKVGVLFSGGVDSALVARLAQESGAEVTLYVAGLEDKEKQEPHDITSARKAASLLRLPLVEVRATLREVEEALPALSKLIEDGDVMKVGVALPLWLCCKKAREDGQRIILSGLGGDEVFGGYARIKQARDVNKECLRAIRQLYERSLYRDDVVGMSQTIEIRLPLLDKKVVGKGLGMEGKVDGERDKIPLREAAIELGVPAELALQKKRAAQYGSGFDAALEKLARRKGLTKSEYLRTIYPVNARLCALLSTGKDSIYAMHTMQRMNYEIICAATIISKNPDSYMYHTPLVRFAHLQAEAMDTPLLTEETEGVKEEELAALKKVLSRAKAIGCEGVVSGALYSDYQRKRIEEICEELGLRVFAPLWHIDQEQEMREIIDAGFQFMMSKVAAEGLDKSWVGRIITHEDVDTLKKKLRLNIAGEGGEFETLVLDGPCFNKKIQITSSSVKCEGQVSELVASGELVGAG